MIKQKVTLDIFNWFSVYIVKWNDDEIREYCKKNNIDFPLEKYWALLWRDWIPAHILLREEYYDLWQYVHELFHLIYFIQERYDIELSFQNDEIWAYIIKYIFNKTRKKLEITK